MADSKDTIRLLESRRYTAMCEADATDAREAARRLARLHAFLRRRRQQGELPRRHPLEEVAVPTVERPIEDIQVHGDCAVVTGQVRIELLSGGQPKKLNSRFTNVWVKGRQGWQMVAWQSTPLPA